MSKRTKSYTVEYKIAYKGNVCLEVAEVDGVAPQIVGNPKVLEAVIRWVCR